MRRFIVVAAAVGSLAAVLPAQGAVVDTSAVSLFSNTPLIATQDGWPTSPYTNSTGDSEPAITFAGDGTMVVDGLAWLPWQVNVWKGKFGSTPAYAGAADTSLQAKGSGRTTVGDGDADVEVTSAGTLLLADLTYTFNQAYNGWQNGIEITRCPAGSASVAECPHIYLDSAGSDRPWLTVAGTTAWIVYHDSTNSTLIRVKRSDDDGATWKQVSSPIPGAGNVTAGSTYNNSLGPIVADPASPGVVYEAFAAGEPQTKGSSSDYNNIYVARSGDGGASWTSSLVYHASPFTRLNNFWPSLAVDPVTHALGVVWTDLHGVSESTSQDGGVTWSPATTVSTVATTVMPNIAMRNGKIDVVYYGSDAASNEDSSAVWQVYDSQSILGAWAVKRVSNNPNRRGAVCVLGDDCTANRELLDLFEVAEDPVSGKAAVIYTDTTIDTVTWSGTSYPLPEIVLAFEK